MSLYPRDCYPISESVRRMALQKPRIRRFRGRDVVLVTYDWPNGRDAEGEAAARQLATRKAFDTAAAMRRTPGRKMELPVRPCGCSKSTPWCRQEGSPGIILLELA